MNFIKTTHYYDSLGEDINHLVSENKVVHIANVPETADIDKLYVGLGEKVGMLFRKDIDPVTRTLIHDSWTMVKYDERYVNDTYKHSNKAQPLHTDYCNASIPLDIVLLICAQEAKYGGATTFVDSGLIVDILTEYKPELLTRLRTEEVIFGKAPHPVFRNKATIISEDEVGVVLHWNYAVVAPDNTPEVLAMCEEFHDFLENYIVRAGLTQPVYLKKGDAVFMQDKRIMHGRNAFWGDRHLLKGGIAVKDLDSIKLMLKDLGW